MLWRLQQKLEKEGLDKNKTNEIISDLVSSDIINNSHTDQLKNTKARNSFYKRNFAYIEPDEIVIGYDNDGTNLTYQYVPIVKTLRSIYDRYGKEYFTFEKGVDGEMLRDVHDGYVFKSNTLFQQQKALQILLYEDSFEVANPLGSAQTKHKVIAVYLTLANFKAHLLSSIDHIQLVLLCRESIAKEVGYCKLFE